MRCESGFVLITTDPQKFVHFTKRPGMDSNFWKFWVRVGRVTAAGLVQVSARRLRQILTQMLCRRITFSGLPLGNRGGSRWRHTLPVRVARGSCCAHPG